MFKRVVMAAAVAGLLFVGAQAAVAHDHGCGHHGYSAYYGGYPAGIGYGYSSYRYVPPAPYYGVYSAYRPYVAPVPVYGMGYGSGIGLNYGGGVGYGLGGYGYGRPGFSLYIGR